MGEHTILTIGDPHLGHQFRVGVPLHRLGQREMVVLNEFERSLEAAGICGADLCVCMGDLFETHTVPNNLVEETAHIYSTTARTYPTTTYVLLKGNHDWHRNHEQVSSFDILAEMLSSVDNIVVASKPQRLYMDDGTVYGLFPWMPPEPRTALEWAQYICYDEPDIRTVFGHWDSAWSEHNIIPAKFFASRGIKTAYSGHDHVAREEVMNGLPVIWTGSMMPYQRSHDTEGVLYKTVTLSEYTELNQDTFHPYCYHVVLEPGQELPYGIDAWEIRTSILMSQDEAEELHQIGEVAYGDGFNMQKLWDEALAEVPPSVRSEVQSLYKEHMT